jgi:hypothetical protein
MMGTLTRNLPKKTNRLVLSCLFKTTSSYHNPLWKRDQLQQIVERREKESLDKIIGLMLALLGVANTETSSESLSAYLSTWTLPIDTVST